MLALLLWALQLPVPRGVPALGPGGPQAGAQSRAPEGRPPHLCVLSLGSLRARAGRGPEGSPGTEEGESSVGPVSTLCGGMVTSAKPGGGARRGRS